MASVFVTHTTLPIPSLLLLVIILAALIANSSITGAPARLEAQATIKSDSSLVLVDAVVEQKKGGEAITDLAGGDFVVRDNGKPVTLVAVNRGRDGELRPIQLWLLAMCNAGAWDRWLRIRKEDGSSFLAGKMALLRPALTALNADETVGVARWCGDDAEIVLPPTFDREKPLEVIDTIAHLKSVTVSDLSGETGRLKALELINEHVGTAFPPPLPAVLLLTSGAAGHSAASGPLVFTTTFFGMSAPERTFESLDKSGFAGSQDEFSNRLVSIVDILHKRYQLSFQPAADIKTSHTLRVELTSGARKRFPHAVVSYRDSYAVPAQSTDKLASINATFDKLDAKIRDAVTMSRSLDGLRFTATRPAASAVGFTEITFKLDPSSITWTAMPNGDRRSVVTSVVASLSATGKPIGLVVKNLEIVQNRDRLQAIKSLPVMLTVTAATVKGTARTRLIVRDMASGRIGATDL